jgi:hypothetical protein
MARNVFYSFHYDADNWRAAQVRSMGVIDGNEPCSDNDWESVTKGGDPAIERWIAKQLEGRTCAVVLVGSDTAGRKWITHEIKEAWNGGRGVVGIHIHNLKNQQQLQSHKGGNPFGYLHFVQNPSKYLSSVAKLYDPPYSQSTAVYAYIKDNLAAWIEEAIEIKDTFKL